MCVWAKVSRTQQQQQQPPQRERDARVNLVFGLMLLSNNWQEEAEEKEEEEWRVERGGGEKSCSSCDIGGKHFKSSLFCKKRSFIRYINDIHT